MFDALIALGLFASSFAATNVDNLALLVGWLLAGRGRNMQVFVGHLIGMLAILLLTLAFGLGANLIPVQYVGYLGVIPIALGLKGLYALSRGSGGIESTHEITSAQISPLSIAATQVANGVDTILVFGPLLGDSESGVDFILIGGFFAMSLLWFGLARFLEHHASRLTLLERYGHWIAPIVLILVGFYIIADTTTDVLMGQ
jgi:cadmium resistance protein CadD (predicted permease)